MSRRDGHEREPAVCKLTATPGDEWDAYVASHAQASFFHLSGWHRVIVESFAHKPHYLCAVDATGNMVGLLPLVEMKSLLFGHALKSIPFGVYGGAIGDSDAIVSLLEHEADRLGRDLGVDYLELRNRVPTREDWPAKITHATFIGELADDAQQILQSIKKKQRAVVRKALGNELDCEVREDIEGFFYAYSTSVRNLGTPVFSKAYFRNLKREFGDACEIVVVRHRDRLQSALMTFYFKDQVMPFYGGGLPESRRSRAMDFMYYDLMVRAASSGYRTFDFGRSKIDSGPYHYKRHWGFEPQPLHYQYSLIEADRLPDVSVTNPRYQSVIAAWRRLPLGLSQRIGPLVSRHLG